MIVAISNLPSFKRRKCSKHKAAISSREADRVVAKLDTLSFHEAEKVGFNFIGCFIGAFLDCCWFGGWKHGSQETSGYGTNRRRILEDSEAVKLIKVDIASPVWRHFQFHASDGI